MCLLLKDFRNFFVLFSLVWRRSFFSDVDVGIAPRELISNKYSYDDWVFFGVSGILASSRLSGVSDLHVSFSQEQHSEIDPFKCVSERITWTGYFAARGCISYF